MPTPKTIRENFRKISLLKLDREMNRLTTEKRNIRGGFLKSINPYYQKKLKLLEKRQLEIIDEMYVLNKLTKIN